MRPARILKGFAAASAAFIVWWVATDPLKRPATRGERNRPIRYQDLRYAQSAADRVGHVFESPRLPIPGYRNAQMRQPTPIRPRPV